MTIRTYGMALLKMLALCCVLTFALQVGASQAADPGVRGVQPDAASALMPAAPAEVCAATQGHGASATPSFSDLVATPEWQSQTAGYCQYTCPQNLVQLCPDFPGASKSCVNGCCVYS